MTDKRRIQRKDLPSFDRPVFGLVRYILGIDGKKVKSNKYIEMNHSVTWCEPESVQVTQQNGFPQSLVRSTVDEQASSNSAETLPVLS